ncbi:MAG: hypothetical protein H6543_04305 [Prevotellaceae bacterium]|nr:hypothetical protein [Prevotellaceae bacterium]
MKLIYQTLITSPRFISKQLNVYKGYYFYWWFRKLLTSNSRADMYANAHLKDGQAIINVSTTVSYKIIAGPIYMQRIATTGYIIEFVK